MGLCTGEVSALLVGFLPGISSQFKATHQAIDDVALMRALPGMTVLDPLDSTETVRLALDAVEQGGPCYMRASRGAVPTVLPESAPAGIGTAIELRSGADVALVASGMASRWALEAAEELAAEGVGATVPHVGTLKPFDPEPVIGLAQRFPVLHCVENHSSFGGLTTAVSEVVAAHGVGVRVISSAIPDRWGEYGRLDFNRVALGLDSASIAQHSLEFLVRRPIRERGALAHSTRKVVVDMCTPSGQGYAGQGMELADILACLHGSVLRRHVSAAEVAFGKNDCC